MFREMCLGRLVCRGAIGVLAASGVLACGGCASWERHEQVTEQAEQHWNVVRADVKARLASEQLAAGNLDQAGQSLDEARRLDPENTKLKIMQARTWIGQGRSDDAQQLLDTIHTDGAQLGQVEYLRGIIDQQRLAWSAALDHFLAAVDADTSEVAYLTAAVQVLLQLGDAESALALLGLHADALDWTPAFNAAAAECYEQMGRWDEAARAWQRVVDHDEDAEVGERLAIALWRAKRWGEAETALRELLESSEKTPPVTLRLALAECCISQGKTEAARSTLREILADQPQNVAALTLLAQAFVHDGALPEALRACQRGLAAAPANVTLLELAAGLAKRLGDQRRVLRYVERLRHIQPDSPVIHLVTGHAE